VSSSPSSSPDPWSTPILHIDLDAFFASVEILDDPSLKGRPVCVGGSGERGVIASASYEARRFGVRSAMASSLARRLCSELVILPGRFDRYEEYSARFHEVLEDVTWRIEPLGLDEAFLDLSSAQRVWSDPLETATSVRSRLRDELGLDSAVGVARNKLFAKLASKRAKPRFGPAGLSEGVGVLWVTPDIESRWLDSLGVEELLGVGPATSRKLARLGVIHVRDLRQVPEDLLVGHLGSALARTLSEFARGEDSRVVESSREAKSIGHEETFAVSVSDDATIEEALHRHAGVVARALRERHLVARRVTVIARDDELRTRSRSQTLNFGLDDEGALGEVACALGLSLERTLALRLLGIHVSQLEARAGSIIQLSFDMGGDAAASSSVPEVSRRHQVDQSALRDAVDDIRRRFGASVLGRGSQLREGRLKLSAQRSDTPFGPAREEP
jgi:DNA polymerase-4